MSNASQLAFTKILEITIDGNPEPERNHRWSLLRDHLIYLAHMRQGDVITLLRNCQINFVHGEKTTEGYKYLPYAGVSIQGQNAFYAGSVIMTIAQSIGVALLVRFQWEHIQGAAHPGKQGVIKVN